MIRELPIVLTICLLAICTMIHGQDTVDIQLDRIVFSASETAQQRTDKVLGTCISNTYPPGVVIRFDPSPCGGPILISPLFDRSDPSVVSNPAVAQSNETIVSAPYIYQVPNDDRFFVHCGTQFKEIATCVDFNAALLPNTTSIPTLSTWGIILLFITICISVIVIMKQSQITQRRV